MPYQTDQNKDIIKEIMYWESEMLTETEIDALVPDIINALDQNWSLTDDQLATIEAIRTRLKSVKG